MSDKSISSPHYFAMCEDGNTYYYGRIPNKCYNETVPSQVQLLPLFQVVAYHHDHGTLIVPEDDEHPLFEQRFLGSTTWYTCNWRVANVLWVDSKPRDINGW
jgi:hypothetical protein